MDGPGTRFDLTQSIFVKKKKTKLLENLCFKDKIIISSYLIFNINLEFLGFF